MKCGYCGRENPDGTVFCECGRPLTYDKGGSAFSASPEADGLSAAYASNAQQKPKSTLRGLILIAAVLVLGLGAGFGAKYIDKLKDEKTVQDIQDISTWQTINTADFSMKAPSCLQKGEMINISQISGNTKGLSFYYSKHAAFSVSFYKFSKEEKEIFGSLSAEESEELIHSDKIYGWLNRSYAPREGKDYVYYETDNYYCSYIGTHEKEDALYIEGKYAAPDGWYFVETYCLLEDKDELRDEMLEILDSFTIK